MRRINVTARGKGSGDAWCVSVRRGQMSREEKRGNRAYWRARIGYGRRWVVEDVFSLFKRVFDEHQMAPMWEKIV